MTGRSESSRRLDQATARFAQVAFAAFLGVTISSTIGMQVRYPSPATTNVVADAHVQQRSEELFFSTVHVTAVTSGQLVAMGRCVTASWSPGQTNTMPENV